MRLFLLFFIFSVATAYVAMRIQPQSRIRSKTIEELKAPIALLARHLPDQGTVGLINNIEEDGEVIHEVRWLLYPRVVEVAHLHTRPEQDTLLVIQYNDHPDTAIDRLIQCSNRFASASGQRFSYQLLIPLPSYR